MVYQFVLEGGSSDECMNTCINIKEYPADILTKNFPAGLNMCRKARMCLFDIYTKEDEYDKTND